MRRDPRPQVLVALVLLALGLPTRLATEHLPGWYNLYAGDFLWAMLVFLVFANVLRLTTRRAALASLAFAFAVEVSQLFHPAWLEQLRANRLLSLVLGHGFLWSDLAAYTLGVGVAVLVDRALGPGSPEA